MDFIDDFIREYKNNPCLWRADCANFKNRTKRQEAYMKLIEVAAKHGEHYNIERTKQKINNLRCAFRHQLRKITESKTKGEKDDTYCPKRRYFESLMFLRDEETLDKKTKRNNSSSNAHTSEDNEPTAIEQECAMELADSSISQYKDKSTNITSSDNSMEAEQIQNKSDTCKAQSATTNGEPPRTTIIENLTEYEDDIYNKIQELIPPEKSAKDPKTYACEQDVATCPTEPILCRKRSSSISSQASKDAEPVHKRSSKVDFPSVDFERLFSLACKSIHNNMDDHYSNFGKIIAHKLRMMEPAQAIFAEKIIADVLFHGQMKMLSVSSVNQFLSID